MPLYEDARQSHLAWHETLEMHELVAFQSNGLIGFKMDLPHVTDPELRSLYAETIQTLERHLNELLPFYAMAPVPKRAMTSEDLTAYYAGHLLGFAKTAVRYYAFGITETATPALREVLLRQLNQLILLHAKAFNFMLARGLYPSYDLPKLLATDKKNAAMALQL